MTSGSAYQRPVFTIRPEPGFSATLAKGRAAGLDIGGTPLFELRPVAWDAPDPAGVDGLLLGSANAVRHGGSALAHYKGKSAFVVGEATAEAARGAGFDVAMVGEGGLQSVLDRLAGRNLTLLRLAGAERIALEVPDTIRIVTRTAYESVALPMPASLADSLRAGGVVMLHSAAAARHFSDECTKLGIDRGNLSVAALGPRILAAAGDGWQEVRAAQSPRESDLLALASDMCHGSRQATIDPEKM
ncbi:MAG: uroporphyrinogen-III synthase [Novosphingobium sp.]|nr:uroporphyrinogen-III synthase [Novosphingobium sp.]